MSEEDLSLAADFAPASREDWMKLVTAALKGAPADRLVARTYDDLAIEPLYAGDRQAKPILGRVPGRPWQIMQRVDHPDAAAANAEALHDLENGADGLTLVFAGAAGCYGYGLDASDATLARALEGVMLDAAAIELDAGPQSHEVAAGLAALVKKGGIAPSDVDIRFGFDPIGVMTQRSAKASAWSNLAPQFARTIADLAARGFRGPFAAADGRPVHAAGGSEAQELAFVLATAIAYLRALEAGGTALDRASGMIFFRLAADTDQFLTIAKFRAARKLWGGVQKACGMLPVHALVTTETAWRMMTKRDPWVNMLRTTMAVFAAGLGGADSISVLPFTAALGLPDRFARRMARNTQHILLDESNLAKVTDPAAGSGVIEDLTAKLCQAAWTLFQEIEAAGGVMAALERGLIQEKIARVRATREERAAKRIEPLTGTSEFAHLQETPVSVLDVPRVEEPPASTTALPRIRLAAPFEALRDRSDAILAARGTRPKIFLANLGRPAAFTPRATFAKNFFEAGGIEALSNDGFEDKDAMVGAFTASGTTLICLCSSDEVYAEKAADAAKALRAAGARHIYLAGRPRDLESPLKAAGVQSFIYAGCNVIAVLGEVYDRLNVKV